MSSLAERYAASINFLARAEAVIPLASQTFSKSRTQYPVGAAPLFALRSQGCRTWDIDGNEYVDLVSSLGAVALGYGDDEINEAVIRQLKDGVTLSLAHPIESEVAEQLVDLIPCAEMVRFGKNGSDATAAAIRLARAKTGRNRVIVCGYHGWQDWYIGSTNMNRGVPEVIRELTHTIPYNDLDALMSLIRRYPGEFAALIMEPMTSVWPLPNYLEEIRTLTHEQGIILIFDETLTGFRFAPGGAQEYFGVTPDLATFGKALANGFPLSAVVGRRDLLELMPSIFFSATFGGETLSLAAAKVVLERMATGEPTRYLSTIGQDLTERIDAKRPPESANYFSLVGHPSWVFHKWLIQDADVLAEARTLLLQEMLRRGVLVLGTHDVTTAFGSADVESVADAFALSLKEVCDGIKSGDILERLQCEPIKPLFKVRA